MHDRITWDTLWMETAKLVGRRSQCVRAQYGAVIVSDTNRVLSVGYNGPPRGGVYEGPCSNWCDRAKTCAAGGEPDAHYLDCLTIHAECNALLLAPELRDQHSSLYVNAVCCHRCTLMIANSGVEKVIMLNTKYEQKRNPWQVSEFLQAHGIDTLMMMDWANDS